MGITLTRSESLLLALAALLLLAALSGPHLPQPPHYHGFADQRVLAGVPRALDVLSNLPFALAGVAGLRLLRDAGALALAPAQGGCARLFFIGLVLTALASAWYHLQPDDAGLMIDRAGMSVAFAGLLGLLVAAQVSDRAGRAVALAVLVVAPATIAVWRSTGNLLPWVLLQAGGMLLLALGFRAARPGALHVRWSIVLAAYGVAKLFEAGDHLVFDATGQLLSGHTVKHLLAALAAWPVVAALVALRPGQDGAQRAAAARA